MNARGQYGKQRSVVGGRIGRGFDLDRLRDQALRSVRIASGANPAPFWVVGIVPSGTDAWAKSVLAFGTREDAEDRFASYTATGTPYMFVQTFGLTERGPAPILSWHNPDVMTPAGLPTIGREGFPQLPEAETPTWAVAIIAGGVGMALHALWGAVSKKRDIAAWTAR